MKLEKPIVVMIMGKPGSGKDTQAEILAEKHNLEVIVTSDILRRKFKENPDDPEVRKEKEIYDTGELNTPEWVLKTVKDYIKNLFERDWDGKNGIILSGSPRTLFEAERFIPFLKDIFGKDNMYAFDLEISDEEGMQRILERSARELDKDPETLKVRMQEYRERTQPAVDYIEECGILEKINGMQTIDEVAADIKDKLHEKL